MRATLSSIPFGTTLRCAPVELIEDISVPYRINAIASHEDLTSTLRAGESESVINKGSSSGVKNLQTQLTSKSRQPNYRKPRKQRRRSQ